MSAEWVREVCLSLPKATESVQWGEHLLFKIGGKMFAITSLEPAGNVLSLKVDPERYEEFTERPGVIPAPYLARAKWVALEDWAAIPKKELHSLLLDSYELVLAKLPKRLQAELRES